MFWTHGRCSGCPKDRSINRLIARTNDRSIDRSFGQSIDRTIDSSIQKRALRKRAIPPEGKKRATAFDACLEAMQDSQFGAQERQLDAPNRQLGIPDRQLGGQDCPTWHPEAVLDASCSVPESAPRAQRPQTVQDPNFIDFPSLFDQFFFSQPHISSKLRSPNRKVTKKLLATCLTCHLFWFIYILSYCSRQGCPL